MNYSTETMLVRQPTKVMYISPTTPVRKNSYRSPVYLTRRHNQILPRPIFTCIDEIYSTPAASYPLFQHTYVPLNSSSQESKDSKSTESTKYRKWLLAIIIIIIILCIITIIVLLVVFLTRSN